MSDFSLMAKTALNLDEPVDESWDGFRVTEIVGQPFLWLAVDPAGKRKLEKACLKHLGLEMPEQGRTAAGTIGDEEAVMAWMAPGQWALRGVDPESIGDIGKCCRVTDQSDGWVGIFVTGTKSRDVLARLCGLDLHESRFPAGSAARSPFEGMHCHIAARDPGEGRYDLFFQRSSARSFLEHLRHAAYSVCGRRTDIAD